MDDDGSSSVDPPRGVDIPPDDRKTMVSLCQKCPKLRGAFKEILLVVDLMTTKRKPDVQVCNALLRTHNHFSTYRQDIDDIMRFTSVTGFVERSVAFARQILQDMGRSYLIRFPTSDDQRNFDPNIVALKLIRNQILNATCCSSEFSQRLIKTGFLQDLVEDVKHIQHLSVEALVRGDVFLLSVGTIHNCCQHKETIAAVRELDIVPHITPFLTKRGDNQLIRSIAVAVTANVIEDDQLHLLRLDSQLIQYFMKVLQDALNGIEKCQWEIREILFDLYLVARNDFSRRLMVAQGMLSKLHAILEPTRKRPEKEKKDAVALIHRLIEDPVNLHICQNYRELVGLLKDLAQNGADKTVEEVPEVLGKLECHNKEKDPDELIPTDHPHLSELISGQTNLLVILHMGLVELVLDKLKVFTGGQGFAASARGDKDHVTKVLLALNELADDEPYRREIMSRGGMDMMKTILENGGTAERTEAARAVLKLTMAEENREIIQIDADLATLLLDLNERADNTDLTQTVDSVLSAVYQ
ncbi:uncharacterized protein LOC143296287 isoform X2 [Babylonia areolata]|uniref:uncharacterized protein LOC143296287 isoform X2 n=1 Tax=Babylonia areolata TaxID=304850 RepID=UPI003FD1EB3A